MRPPILMWYRPSYPSWRAQDIQVLHAAHALAQLGHPVTILANRNKDQIQATDVLQAFELPPCDTLTLRLSPFINLGVSGLWFRQAALRWWIQNDGIVIVRDLKRLAQYLPWLPGKQRIIIEAHQLPSLQAQDRGQDNASLTQVEYKVLKEAWGLISNCGGVMRLWEHHHSTRLPKYRKVIHNGTAPSRQLTSPKHTSTIRCLGSLRPEKGIHQLLPALTQSRSPIELIGASPEELRTIGPLPSHIQIRPAVPYPEVPPQLASARALLLPLQNNRFGQSLTSPLKLWDYLATDRPILAPELPSVQEIAALSNRRLHYYNPDRPMSLLECIHSELPSKETPYLRSWYDRAVELSEFISQ